MAFTHEVHTFFGPDSTKQVTFRRASDDQKRKVGIFVKTRLGLGEGPRGPKRHLLGRIGAKKVLETRSELASRLRASDDQKRNVGIRPLGSYADFTITGMVQIQNVDYD